MIHAFLEFEESCAAVTLAAMLIVLSVHSFKEGSGHGGLSQARVMTVNVVIFIISVWGQGWQADAAIYGLTALLTGYLVWHLRGTLRGRG